MSINQETHSDFFGYGWARRTVTLVFFAGLMVMGYAAAASAAPGDLDPNFGSYGKVMTDFSSGFDAGSAVAVQDDGKVIVAGSAFDPALGGFKVALARYNPDGTPDSTFGGGDGRVMTGFTDDGGAPATPWPFARTAKSSLSDPPSSPAAVIQTSG